jgi:hypothetical protein
MLWYFSKQKIFLKYWVYSQKFNTPPIQNQGGCGVTSHPRPFPCFLHFLVATGIPWLWLDSSLCINGHIASLSLTFPSNDAYDYMYDQPWKYPYLKIVLIFFGDWTQFLTLDRQLLYHLLTSSANSRFSIYAKICFPYKATFIVSWG